MLRVFTCILCPQGCEIKVELPDDPAAVDLTAAARTENGAAAGADDGAAAARADDSAAAAGADGRVRSGMRIEQIAGNRCLRGAAYVTQEIEAPMRNIATSILVEGGELPLASVRLTRPVPRKRLSDVMEAIKKIKVSAPIQAGTIVIPDVLGLGSDVIVTKTVEKTDP